MTVSQSLIFLCLNRVAAGHFVGIIQQSELAQKPCREGSGTTNNILFLKKMSAV